MQSAAARSRELELNEVGVGTRVGRSGTRSERRPIFSPSNPSIVTILAAVVPEAFTETIIKALDRGAAKRGALVMNPEERGRRLAELDIEILSLQRSEECIISALAPSRVYVPRRRFAAPEAVLMIEVAAATGPVAIAAE